MLLSSLPDTYDTLITALEVRDEKDLTMTLVENKLLEENEKQKKRKSGEDTVLKATNKFRPKANNKSKKIVCHYCHGVGHIRKDCWKFKNSKSDNGQNAKVAENDEANSYFVLNVKSGVWVVDSGATCHICSVKEEFISLDLSWREKVTVADGGVAFSTGKGSCKIKLVNRKGGEVIITVDNVLYIPSFKGSLLSVKKMSAVGFKVLFSGSSCRILDMNNVEVGVADCVNNLYQLKTGNREAALTAVCNLDRCQHYYHKLFGHRDFNAVRAMQSGKLENNFDIVDCKIRKTCDICVKCKLSRKPFPNKSESRTGEVLELIHSDICGPMQTVTPGGRKYFLTLIDDYSRYTIVYLLNEKS